MFAVPPMLGKVPHPKNQPPIFGKSGMTFGNWHWFGEIRHRIWGTNWLSFREIIERMKATHPSVLASPLGAGFRESVEEPHTEDL